MSATKTQDCVNNGAIMDQVNHCVETGRSAVEAAKQKVKNHTDAGREVVNNAAVKTQEALRVTREKAQAIAQGSKEKIENIMESATAYVSTNTNGHNGNNEYNSDETSTYAGRVLSAAGQYVESGKKVVQNSMTQSRHCVDEAKKLRQKASEAVAQSKPRLVAISENSKRAVKERNVHFAVAAAAQLVACVLLVMNAVVEAMGRLQFVKRRVNNVWESTYVQKIKEWVEWADVPKNVARVPVVGPRLLAAVSNFSEDVKKNM